MSLLRQSSATPGPVIELNPRNPDWHPIAIPTPMAIIYRSGRTYQVFLNLPSVEDACRALVEEAFVPTFDGAIRSSSVDEVRSGFRQTYIDIRADQPEDAQPPEGTAT